MTLFVFLLFGKVMLGFIADLAKKELLGSFGQMLFF